MSETGFQLIASGPEPGDFAVQTFESLDACLAEASQCLVRAAAGLLGDAHVNSVGSSIRLTITVVEA